MTCVVKPLSFEATKLKGLSEKLIVSHCGEQLRERHGVIETMRPVGDRPDRGTPVAAERNLGTDGGRSLENTYGNAVRTLNAVRRELAALDAGTPPYRLRGLKREELSLMGSVALHELYFANLGGYRRAGPNSGLGRPGDARFLRGGISAWYALGGARALRPPTG